MRLEHVREVIDRKLRDVWSVVRSQAIKIRVDAVTEDAGARQLAFKGRAGEVDDGVEHFETYGLTSSPPAGAQGVYLSIGGDPEHGVIICVGDRRVRIKTLKNGEVCLYHEGGSNILLNEDGGIVATSQEGATFALDKDGAIKGTAKEGQTLDLNVAGEVVLTGKEGQTVTLDSSGDVVVEPKPGSQLKVGGTASDQIVTADKLHTYLTALFGSGAPGAADGGAALKLAWTGYLAANSSAAFAAAKGVAE